MRITTPSGAGEDQLQFSPRLLIAALLTASILPRSPLIPLFPAVAVTGLVFVGVCVCLWLHHEDTFTGFRIYSVQLAALTTIYAIYILHWISDPANLELALRTVLYIGVSATALLYLPSVTEFEDFTSVIPILVGLLLLVGLPGMVIEAVHIRKDETMMWVGGVHFYTLNSVFNKAAAMSYLSALGIVISVSSYLQTHSRRGLLLIGGTVLALLFAQGRAATVAAIGGTAIVLAHHRLSSTVFERLACGAIAVVGFVGVVVAVIGPSELLSMVDLSGRTHLWQASIEAITRRPFGWGARYTGDVIKQFMNPSVCTYCYGKGPHNSYLRMFVSTGIIGGGAFIILICSALWVLLQRAVTNGAEAGLSFALISMLAVMMFFETWAVFGLYMQSIIAAWVVGAGIQPRAGDTEIEAR